jgi:hypothetical protein
MALSVPILMSSTSPAAAEGKSTYCQLIMYNLGYSVGPKVKSACGYAGSFTCYSKMRNLGVDPDDATLACQI